MAFQNNGVDKYFSPKVLFSELDELASVLPSGKLEKICGASRRKIFLAQKFSGWEGRRTAGGGPPAAAAAAAAKIEKRVGWRWLEKSLEKPSKNPNVEKYSGTPLNETERN